MHCVPIFSLQPFQSHKMSGTVESPVSKYGRSSEFGVVLDFIQRMISNDTLRQNFDIPHLVMVGRQNMAKTTLINRLIGRYLLPMRRNETANTLQARTTYPIILNLRNGEKPIVEVKCDKIPDIGGAVENPKDGVVEDFLKQVDSRLPKEPGTPISKTPVNVTLQGEVYKNNGHITSDHIKSYPSHHVISYPILSHRILSYPILSHISYFILSYPILTYPMPHHIIVS